MAEVQRGRSCCWRLSARPPCCVTLCYIRALVVINPPKGQGGAFSFWTPCCPPNAHYCAPDPLSFDRYLNKPSGAPARLTASSAACSSIRSHTAPAPLPRMPQQPAAPGARVAVPPWSWLFACRQPAPPTKLTCLL